MATTEEGVTASTVTGSTVTLPSISGGGPGAGVDNLLKEDGDNLLLEDGGVILLE